MHHRSSAPRPSPPVTDRQHLAAIASLPYDYPDADGVVRLPESRLGAFGEKFRKQREKRAFSLDDVANVTKIGARMLKAIEEERFEQLPGGVFNKGFIRTYAKHLGLNDQEAITEYLEILQRRQAAAEGLTTAAQSAPKAPNSLKNPKGAGGARAPIRPARPTKAQAQPQSEDDDLPNLQLPKAEHVRPRRSLSGGNRAGLSWTVPTLVVLVIVGGIYWWSRHSRSARADSGDSRAVVAPATPVSSLPSQTVVNQAPATQSPSVQTLGKTAIPAPVPAKDAAEANDVTKKNLNAVSPSTPASPVALTLTIRAAENSWISVTADGQHVTQETLIAPAHTSIRASREIVVKAGNAAAVSFLLNGQEFPAQGTEGEVKTFVFDASGMNVGPAAQATDAAH